LFFRAILKVGCQSKTTTFSTSKVPLAVCENKVKTDRKMLVNTK
jgi:hypothetical protein